MKVQNVFQLEHSADAETLLRNFDDEIAIRRRLGEAPTIVRLIELNAPLNGPE